MCLEGGGCWRRGKGQFQDTTIQLRFLPPTGVWGPVRLGGSGYTREKSCFSHLLWLFSSRDLAQKARISKSTPQALGRGGMAPSYPRLSSPPSQHTLSCLLASFPFGVDFCPITETGTLLPHHLLLAWHLAEAGSRQCIEEPAYPGTCSRRSDHTMHIYVHGDTSLSSGPPELHPLA